MTECLKILHSLILSICKICKTTSFNCFISLVLLFLLLRAGDVESNPGPSNFKNCLSICHCNIRSIRNKLEFITDNFLDFDILCFTETHLNEYVSNDSLLLSDKYSTPYRKDRTNHGGGLLIYVSNEFITSRIQELEVVSNKSIWIKNYHEACNIPIRIILQSQAI